MKPLVLLCAAICLVAPTLSAGGVRKVTNGVWTVNWDDKNAWATRSGSAKRVPIYTGNSTESEAKSNDGNWSEESYVMRSIVGSCVSFQETTYSEGGAHPSSRVIFRTRIPGQKEDVKLTDIFPESALVAALSADGVIAKARTTQTAVSDLKALCEQLDGDCEMELSYEVLNQSFVFHHVEGGKVAIRIGVPHGCEAARGKFTQLGLLLPIPPALVDDLADAEQGHVLAIHLKAKK
jgi:hypothetical protein